MTPPLFQEGQDVVSLVTAPGMTPFGLPCEIKKGSIYTIHYLKYSEDRGWLCFLVGLDGWPEKNFAPLQYASDDAIKVLFEEATSLSPF